jgi:carboxyl-terminal processing protease
VLFRSSKPDPRFTQTADQLKAKGITDFQLHYAMETLMRLSKTQTAASAGPRKGTR